MVCYVIFGNMNVDMKDSHIVPVRHRPSTRTCGPSISVPLILTSILILNSLSFSSILISTNNKPS